jgi:acylphosphatase
MVVRRIVRLHGRVQNVGFRDRVLDIARDHAVAGTVRNLLADASLEIDVEGEEAEVERFIDDVLAHPPTYARVTAVDRRAQPPRGARAFTRAASD